MSLWDAFASLPRPSAAGFFAVEHGERRFRVGRSYENHPALLIEFDEPKPLSLARRLVNLSYSPPAAVDIAGNDGIHHRVVLAVLECRTADPDLGEYFFRIARAILLDDPSAATEQGFENALDALVTLFRGLQRTGTRTIQGLWAELAIILWSGEPLAALSSWHSSPRALHDFSAGSFRLEVKSSSRRLREHTFVLDQLAALGEGATIVASLLLDETDDGSSVFDLLRAIAARTGAEPAARLETIVADSLGNSWRDAIDTRFSVDGALSGLRFYAAEDIPTIPQPLPAAIKDVHFTVDLSGTPFLELEDARSRCDLFAQILPTPI